MLVAVGMVLVVVKMVMLVSKMAMFIMASHPEILFSYLLPNHLYYYLFGISVIIFIMLILLISYITCQIHLFLSKSMLEHPTICSQLNLKIQFLSFFHPIIIYNDLNSMNVWIFMILFIQFIAIIARFLNLIDLILNRKVMVMVLFLNIFKVVILAMIMKVV